MWNTLATAEPEPTIPKRQQILTKAGPHTDSGPEYWPEVSHLLLM